jgi:hypothetical protein
MTSFAMLAGMMPMALGLGSGEQSAARAGGDRRSPRRNVRHALIILPAIFADLQSRHARISASLDPDDSESRYFEPELQLETVSDRGDGRAEQHARAAE